MNLLGPTVVLYLLVGIAVTVALYLTDPPRPAGERLLRLAAALPFWPFFLPILLARPSAEVANADDEPARRIAVVRTELEAALAALEEWIGIPEEQRERIETLCAAWEARAERIREMDRLLARPEYAPEEEADGTPDVRRVRQSLAARQENLERLREIRRQSEADLLASLAWVRELTSRIHLARFTDAPAAQAEGLLAQIAAAVEGLSAPPPTAGQTHAIRKAE